MSQLARCGLGVLHVVVLAAALAPASADAQELALGEPIELDEVRVASLAGVRVRRQRSGWSQRVDGVELRVRRGRASRLTSDATSTVRVCDVDAERRERALLGQRRTMLRGSQYPQGHFCCLPERAAMTIVTVTLPRGPRAHVTIEWRVPTARRDALRAVEEALFASVRCVRER